MKSRKPIAVLLAAALALAIALTASSPSGAFSGPAAAAGQGGKAAIPHIKHYFIIVLENEDASNTFGRYSPAPYLAKTLTAKGAFIPNYYGTGHFSLDNYISMVSGQGPNPTTQSDCQSFTDFTPATPAAVGQFLGQGCVFPRSVKTVANQLKDKV